MIAVLDANVLYPFALRDTLLRAAAAVKAGASVIVTLNLRDFRPLPKDLHAKTPDQFLLKLFEQEPRAMLRIVREHTTQGSQNARSVLD